jgi:hypothetical protein
VSDRTSAGIYGEVFELLASDPTEQHKKWALKLWNGSFEHDFSPEQMDADKALKKLGLAIDGICEEFGDECVLYRRHSGKGYER